jgi:hypothetical protein
VGFTEAVLKFDTDGFDLVKKPVVNSFDLLPFYLKSDPPVHWDTSSKTIEMQSSSFETYVSRIEILKSLIVKFFD